MTSSIGMNRAIKGRYAQVGGGSGCRIYVRPHVCLPGGDLDEYGTPILGRRFPRRVPRTVRQAPAAAAAPRHERPGQGGISFTSALCTLGLFVFVLGIITLVNTSKMTERAKVLSSQRAQVESIQKENAQLALQLEAASDAAKICYAAARNLGMVSAQGADVVYLVAPSTRTQREQEKAAVPQARASIYAALFGFLD